ncbi:hypothetical protein ACPESR_13315 [Nocardia testacea]|uniref:hypothetical protein n=1 Tax=Nocardia testacea TaxID=248551 RepID=UPI003C2EC3AC
MTPQEAARIRAGNHRTRTRAGRAMPLAGTEAGDPLVAAARRIRGFVGAGWRFQTGLAGQMPRLFLTGWSL